MVQKEFDLKATVHRLLTPQETLAPWIFDENQKMLSDVRRGLLKIAQQIIDKVIAPIDGLEVSDICLQGSSGDYFYHDKSDFDLFIEVKNTACHSIAKDQKHLDMFLASQIFQFKKSDLLFQNRFIDPKIGAKLIPFIGKYSILNDVWRIKPNKDIIKGLSEDEMIAYYEKKRAEFLASRKKIIEKYRGIKLGNALNDLYIRMVSCDNNIKDYYVFKLLNYENIIKNIGSELIMIYNKALLL